MIAIISIVEVTSVFGVRNSQFIVLVSLITCTLGVEFLLLTLYTTTYHGTARH